VSFGADVLECHGAERQPARRRVGLDGVDDRAGGPRRVAGLVPVELLELLPDLADAVGVVADRRRGPHRPLAQQPRPVRSGLDARSRPGPA
jgi:hypothetical protein